ncbi:Beta-flanking protein, partial [Rhizoctonia solani]
MSLIIDWHFAIHTPAYVEFGWVGLAAGLELASVVLAGISAPQSEVCSLDKTSFGVYEGLVTSGRRVCSNWTAVLVTSVISLIMFIFHFTWHIIFRLWHRAALARRPTAPIDLWNTPIPKYYPINPQETVKREDPAFLALGERGIKPEDSIVMDPYSRIFKPVAVRKAEKLVKDGTVGHEMPVVNVIVSIEDREAKCVQGNASETTLNAPPGIELNMKAVDVCDYVSHVMMTDVGGKPKYISQAAVSVDLYRYLIFSDRTMDNFINLAKQGYEAYSESQKAQHGGQGCNPTQGEYRHNQPSSGGYGGPQFGPSIDQQAAVQNATQHSGGTGDTSLFSTALGFLNQNQAQHTEPINEQHVQNAHAEAYEKGKASSLDAGSLGAAAAMQVLKNFTSGSGPTGSGGGDSRSQLIGMAMSEASKLFESQESKTGQKQDAVNSAAMTVMKLLVQSKTGPGATNAGGNDFGSLLNLASKFLK